MRRFTFYIAIIAAIALTIPVGIKIFSPHLISFTIALLCHLLSSILCTAGFYFLTGRKELREKRGNIWWVYVFILCITAPLYGIVISLAIFTGQKLKKQLPPPILSDDITVQEPEVFYRMENRSRQLEILDRLDIEPFVDIFRRGQADLKKSAVKLLGNMKSKQSLKTLMLALMDPDIEIRLFAASILGKIEDEYAIEIKKKTTSYDSDPSNEDLAIDLVDYYISYATSGLLDLIAKTYYYQESLKILDKLPDSETVLYMKAISYFALEDYKAAKKNIKKCLKLNGTELKYIELYWNILFSDREFAEMSSSIIKAKKQNIQGISKEFSDFWGHA
jgi:tetratricopeptide (TPR) repeat protein